MLIVHAVAISFIVGIYCQENLTLFSTAHTSFLEHYRGYVDVVINQVKIPENVEFTSFKFSADNIDMSIYGCTPINVSLSLKYGSYPFVNADYSKLPKSFKNISRPNIYELELRSDKKPHYVNITSPRPGFYYVCSYLPYKDPHKVQIKQQGLGESCSTFIDLVVYISVIENVQSIVPNSMIYVEHSTNRSSYYKFRAPKRKVGAILVLQNIQNLSQLNRLVARINIHSVPSVNVNIKSETMNSSNEELEFDVVEDMWYFIQFEFDYRESKVALPILFNFTVNLVTSDSASNIVGGNSTISFKTAVSKVHRTEFKALMPFKQYDLLKESITDSFMFVYNLNSQSLDSVPPPVLNLTSKDFSVMKFELIENTDIGGTLQFSIAFKPKVTKTEQGLIFMREPDNHIVIGCVSRDTYLVPVWPNGCSSKEGTVHQAPVSMNKTQDNSSIMIPYPEAGRWYASLRLFCEPCEPCKCSEKCKEQLRLCTVGCEKNCEEDGLCGDCSKICTKKIVEKTSCDDCDCDWPCRKSNVSCNTSVVFDLGSYPCVLGQCGRNGRCVFLISDGITFSGCMCLNQYKGFDCSDGSDATPYWKLVLELVLLVVSNIVLIPVVYIAFRRKLYVEAVVYAATFFFSTFYHACDAGENIISFCITGHSSLQFGDFFSALLSIWVTLLTVADLPGNLTPIFQIAGAIILAYCTESDKTSLWIFMLPTCGALLVISVNWYLKYRKVGQRFLSKQYISVYVPLAAVVATIGLIIYTLLQTNDNYMYLHSLWHIIITTALVLVLPQPDTFHPEAEL